MPGAVGFRDCESGQRERWGPFTVHGLFIRRRHDVAEVYTRMVLEAQPDVLDAIPGDPFLALRFASLFHLPVRLDPA